MKSGIELIADERQRQLDNGRTPDYDAANNADCQLSMAARYLSLTTRDNDTADMRRQFAPRYWNTTDWVKITGRPYIDRLVIAGALIAAEIDRINFMRNGPAD